jgi:predicted PurR-regulated permease PerM
MTQSRTAYLFLLCLTAIVAYGFYLLIAPLLKPVFFAAVAAIIFYPMYAWIRRKVVTHRSLASLLATLIVVLLLAVSFVLLGRVLAGGIHETYDTLNVNGDGRERLGAYLLVLSDRATAAVASYLPISAADLRATVDSQLQRVPTIIVGSAAGLVTGIASGLVNILICAFVLFFLFRDGRNLVRRAYVWLPLRIDQARRLLIRIQETLRAIVYGTLAVAVLQGTLAGFGFWILGVSSPVLWATVTALCSLVPVIGTGFVLTPAISMLAFHGHWIKALVLLAWGLAIVHPIDNVLRPYLIGERTKLSTLLVFFSLVGGLRAFGTLGVFLGPVILAAALALFSFVREESRRAALGAEWNHHRVGQI